MRNVSLLMHMSLDGYVAGPNGEMDWIRFDGGLIDDVAALTASADAVLFGRVTYEMMASYWPTAADDPNATSLGCITGEANMAHCPRRSSTIAWRRAGAGME